MTTEERSLTPTAAVVEPWRLAPPTDLDALTNYVEVVGVLERTGRLNDAKVIARRYSEVGAAVEQLRVQVLDAAGTVAYGMRLAVPAALRRSIGAQVATLSEGQRIKVWGHLNRPIRYDTRFRDPLSTEPDLGREYREVVVEVRGMALATEDDIDGTLVVLQGRVLRPPFIGRHDTDVNLEVARTTLEVGWSFPARPDRPGVLEHGCTTLLIEAPLALENAAATYAAGNVVRIEGRLEPFVERLDPDRARGPVRRQRGASEANVVAEAIARLDAEWEARRGTLTGTELVKAERSYYARRRSLQQDRSLRVRAGRITLVEGTIITVAEARRQRTERMERRRRASERPGARNVAGTSEEEERQVEQPERVEVEHTAPEQGEVGDAAPLVQPLRHRRRRTLEVTEELPVVTAESDERLVERNGSGDDHVAEMPVLIDG